jgi:hypothetical protein
MKMDPSKVDMILKKGNHNWAVDHIATSADDIQEVANFFLNKEEMMSGMHHQRAIMMDEMPSGMDLNRVVKSFESFLFEKKNNKIKSKKKKDQDMDGDMDFADAKVAQYMAGGMSRAKAIALSRKFNKK